MRLNDDYHLKQLSEVIEQYYDKRFPASQGFVDVAACCEDLSIHKATYYRRLASRTTVHKP